MIGPTPGWVISSSDFDGNWSTASSSIATVDTYGTHTGRGVGSTTSTTFADEEWYISKYSCPILQRNSNGNDNVMPSILLGGSNGTNITNTTQSVVVGQQIILYASYSLPSGASVQSQGWTLPGSYVAGYSASSGSGTLNVNTSINAQSVTFYWDTPGNSQTVTFVLTYVYNSQTLSVQAQATLNIAAPSPATPTVSLPTNGQLYIDTLTGCGNNPSGPSLVFGNISGPVPGCPGPYTGQPGIAFSPPATATPAGSFFFVQLVDSDTVKYNALTCTATPGLDGAYPYQSKTGQAVNDAPFSPLPSTYSTSSRSFNATMYLMWQSNTPNSIPVPMGYVTWQFSGSTAQSNGTWGTPTGSGSAGSFTVANGTAYYPTWTGLAVTANNNCH